MRFYIADCHFGHDKVRLLDGRPFASVEEMDEAMIVRWNERVRKKKDEVVILGDLCLGKGEQVYCTCLVGILITSINSTRCIHIH